MNLVVGRSLGFCQRSVLTGEGGEGSCSYVLLYFFLFWNASMV